MHGCTTWQEIHNGLFMRAGFPSVAHYVQPCLLGIVSAELDGTVSMPPPPCSLDLYSALHVFGRSCSELLPFSRRPRSRGETHATASMLPPKRRCLKSPSSMKSGC